MMLKNGDVLEAVDLKVDYLMSPASLDEHGWNLIYVNHYELCAEHTLEQKEWWPFVHCMYGLQDCLNYNTTLQSVNTTCGEAESGVDDDLEISGGDHKAMDPSSGCECTLTGVVDFCATTHTSTTLEELTTCAMSSQAHEWAVKSKARAEAVNSGDPLWIKVNNITLSLSSNEKKEITTWATSVTSAVCDHISLGGGTKPATCENY